MALARWTGTVQDGAGNAVAGAAIEVRNEATNMLVQLYSDREGTVAMGNPFVAPQATFGFHAVGGVYRITAVKDDLEVPSWRFVSMGTAAEMDIDPLLDTVAETVAGLMSMSPNPLRPESFGAQPITSLSDTFDSTAALMEMVAEANATGRDILLSGVYSTEAPLVLTYPGLLLRGLSSARSGLLCRDSDGIKINVGADQNIAWSVRDLAILTDRNNTRTGFSHTAISHHAAWSAIERVSTAGADVFFNPGLGAASRLNGWLTDVELDGARRVKIQNSRFYGAEADRLGGIGSRFPIETAGISMVNCNHIYMEDCFPWLKATAIKGRATTNMEDIQVRTSTLVANKRGVDLQATGGASNDHKILNTHIASYERNIDLFSDSGSTAFTISHSIVGCLLFCRGDSGNVPDFTHIAMKANASLISQNIIYAEEESAPVANNHVGMRLLPVAQGKNRVTDNLFYRQATCVLNDAPHTSLSGSQTVDNASTLAVAPYAGSGANARFGLNFGDRANDWPAPSGPMLKTFANDSAAAAGGVPVRGLYHNAGAVRVRIT